MVKRNPPYAKSNDTENWEKIFATNMTDMGLISSVLKRIS